jgi:hypothetical protein
MEACQILPWTLHLRSLNLTRDGGTQLGPSFPGVSNIAAPHYLV